MSPVLHPCFVDDKTCGIQKSLALSYTGRKYQSRVLNPALPNSMDGLFVPCRDTPKNTEG